MNLRIGAADTMTVDPGWISKHGPAMASAADAIASICGLGVSDPGSNAITKLISTNTITRSSLDSLTVVTVNHESRNITATAVDIQ